MVLKSSFILLVLVAIASVAAAGNGSTVVCADNVTSVNNTIISPALDSISEAIVDVSLTLTDAQSTLDDIRQTFYFIFELALLLGILFLMLKHERIFLNLAGALIMLFIGLDWVQNAGSYLMVGIGVSVLFMAFYFGGYEGIFGIFVQIRERTRSKK